VVKATIKQGDIVQTYRASTDNPTNIGIAEDVLFHMNEISVVPSIIIVKWVHAPFYTGVSYEPSSLRLYCPGECDPEPKLYCNDRAVEVAKKRSRRLVRTGRL